MTVGSGHARTPTRRIAANFHLELHPEKTRLVEFGPYAADNRRRRNLGKPETFNFLGFTHICGKKRSNRRFTWFDPGSVTRYDQCVPSNGETRSNMPAPAERMRMMRERRRSRGLRERRLVVPDSRSQSVRRRVAAQVAHLSKTDENDALNWIESVSEFDAPGVPRKR
jgi:hypothetical protein